MIYHMHLGRLQKLSVAWGTEGTFLSLSSVNSIYVYKYLLNFFGIDGHWHEHNWITSTIKTPYHEKNALMFNKICSFHENPPIYTHT